MNNQLYSLSRIKQYQKKIPSAININQDCAALIRKTDREIKCISYELSNVVSNGENHIIINNKNPI